MSTALVQSVPTESALDTQLWYTYAKGITGNLADPNNVICVDLIPAVFDGTLADALAQVARFGNMIPVWQPHFRDSGTTFFSAYRSWLEVLHPTGGSGDVSGLAALLQNVTTASENYHAQLKDLKQEWIDEGSVGTFADYLQQPVNAPVLTTHLQAISAAQAAYDAAAEKAYGAGYEALEEARGKADAADPFSAASMQGLNTKLQGAMQMTVSGSDGSAEQVPRFGTGEAQLANYRAWLASAQEAKSNGLKPTRVIEFSNTSYEKDTSSYSFSAGGIIPDGFFVASASVSGSGNSESVNSETYTASITFQDAVILDVAPDSSTWFDSGLLRTYANFSDWPAGSVYANTPIWGPNGILSSYVSQVIVGYAPKLTMQFDNWSSSKTHSEWRASASYGIGPFSFGSASASGSADSYTYTETKDGFNVVDNTGVPKIIGLVMATPNFRS